MNSRNAWHRSVVCVLQEVIYAEPQAENGFDVDSETQLTNSGALEPEVECDVVENNEAPSGSRSTADAMVDVATCEIGAEVTSSSRDKETGATTAGDRKTSTVQVVEDQLADVQESTTEHVTDGFPSGPEVEVPEDQGPGAPPDQREMVNQVREKQHEVQVDSTSSESAQGSYDVDNTLRTATGDVETPPNQPPTTGEISTSPEAEMVNTDGVPGEQQVLTDSTANDEMCKSSTSEQRETRDQVDSNFDDVLSSSSEQSTIQPQPASGHESEGLPGLDGRSVFASETAAEDQACGGAGQAVQCDGSVGSMSLTDEVERTTSFSPESRAGDVVTSVETLTHAGDDRSGTTATSTPQSETAFTDHQLIHAGDGTMVADAASPSGTALTDHQLIRAGENRPEATVTDATSTRQSGTTLTDSSVTASRSGSSAGAATDSSGVDRRLTFTFPEPPRHPYEPPSIADGDDVTDDVFVAEASPPPPRDDASPQGSEEIRRGAPAMTSPTTDAPAADDAGRRQQPALGDEWPQTAAAPQPGTELEVSAERALTPGAARSLHEARISPTLDAAAAAAGEREAAKDAGQATSEADELRAADEQPAAAAAATQNFDELKTSSSSSSEPRRDIPSASQSSEGVDERWNEAPDQLQSNELEQQSCADRRQQLTLLIPGHDSELQADSDNTAQVSLCIYEYIVGYNTAQPLHSPLIMATTTVHGHYMVMAGDVNKTQDQYLSCIIKCFNVLMSLTD